MADHIELPDGRTMESDDYQRRLDLLTQPFPQDELEKLPKQMRGKDDDRGKCERGSRYSADGHHCGGWHARAIHLDYVGHAGITARLNEVDPQWYWEPMALTPNGTPLMSDGGMWGKLTVLGVTRIGFGDAAGKNGPNAVKECIGDFIRNAAMRFGVATYLWSKSEAAAAKKMAELGESDDGDPPQRRDESTLTQQRPQETPPQKIDWKALYQATAGDVDKLKALRHTAKNAGAPDDFWLFNAIDKALNPAPIEGNIPA